MADAILRGEAGHDADGEWETRPVEWFVSVEGGHVEVRELPDGPTLIETSLARLFLALGHAAEGQR